MIANIRGGGEFGPAWHKAGMREGKKLAHDDFAAVAQDLIARGVTRRERLACSGGSNGGLLVGNMLTRYPHLFGAIYCGVPLLDMRRYTKLPPGASWIGEYGDPDKPEDWAFLQEISAYHLRGAGQGLSADPARHVQPRRPRSSRPRAQDGGEAQGAGLSGVFPRAGRRRARRRGRQPAARRSTLTLLYAFLRKTIAPEMTEVA